MLRPSYKIDVGSETYELGPRSPVLNLDIETSLDFEANCSRILFNETQKTSKILEGDKITIKLGYEDKLFEVFNGTVVSVEPLTKKILVTGFNLIINLIKKRVNKVYENQTAGKIIEDLVKEAGINVEEISDGLSFPYYFVDDKKNVYDHIKDLAVKCGFDFYLDLDNKAIFKQYERSQPKIYQYARNIMYGEANELERSYTGVTIHGESPSSFKGADTAHWLSKKTVEGLKGEGPQRLIKDPVIKDKDTADQMAEALNRESARNIEGYVWVIGDAEVKIGDTIEIKSMDNEKMNGEFQARAISHLMNNREGFRTGIFWRK